MTNQVHQWFYPFYTWLRFITDKCPDGPIGVVAYASLVTSAVAVTITFAPDQHLQPPEPLRPCWTLWTPSDSTSLIPVLTVPIKHTSNPHLSASSASNTSLTPTPYPCTQTPATAVSAITASSPQWENTARRATTERITGHP